MPITVIDERGEVVIPPEAASDNAEIEADAAAVRSNMYNLIKQGGDALDYALDLAKQSDSPRAFEVVGMLMKNLSDMNMQLLDAQEKKRALLQKAEKVVEGPQKVINNNNAIVFNGSTTDLARMLADMRKEK